MRCIISTFNRSKIFSIFIFCTFSFLFITNGVSKTTTNDELINYAKNGDLIGVQKCIDNGVNYRYC